MSKDSFGVPSELCFDKNEFTKKSFSVDSFLHEYRHAGTLEQIRDDLGLYLKTLRSEMIELINADYADFVSLSAKLTGFDQSIGTIESPLKGLREELVTIKSDLHLAMEQIEKCLKDKEQLQQLKHSLQCITLLASTSRNLEQLLGAVDQYSADSIHVERVVGLLCHQTNYLESCEKYLKPDQLHTVKTLATQSMDLLKHFFIEAIRGSHKKNLECSLRLYSMLNATGTAESIYRSDVVKPHMSKLISEQSLQDSPKGVNGIYDQIIAFIDTNMKDLLQLSSQVDERRYDFLLHSFWPEVEHRLEVNMSSIFAPGNPNFFYQKYQATVEFLVKFETYTPHPEVLRRHKQYKSFMKRWNLPVYFQIRFQEMGGAVETELSKKFTSSLIRPADSVIRLSPVAVALDNVTKCWTEGIYLDPLLAKFLKLTLQIYARLNGWIGEIIKDSSITLELSRTEFMMLIYGDLQRVKMSVPPLITQVQNLMKCAANVSIDRCFSDALGVVKTNENLALAEVVREMLERSQTGIRQVTDIPRLYRKTNREMPTKPCPYVEEMVVPVKEFQTKYGQTMETQHMNETLTSVLSQINAQYFCAVDEVLTSVQKTEESLRRLKTLREKSTPQAASSTSNVTDDDKIRAQFFVDVGHWSSHIEEMGIPREAVDRLPALLSLVNQFSISR